MLGDRRHECVQLWRVNESLLQTYRMQMIVVQSSLLVVGALVAGSGQVSLARTISVGAIAALAVVHLVWIWIPIVRSRGIVAEFYKSQVSADLSEDRLAALARICTRDDFVRDPDLRARVRVEFFGQPPEGRPLLTRFKQDTVVPTLYLMCWVVLVLLVGFG